MYMYYLFLKFTATVAAEMLRKISKLLKTKQLVPAHKKNEKAFEILFPITIEIKFHNVVHRQSAFSVLL